MIQKTTILFYIELTKYIYLFVQVISTYTLEALFAQYAGDYHEK